MTEDKEGILPSKSLEVGNVNKYLNFKVKTKLDALNGGFFLDEISSGIITFDIIESLVHKLSYWVFKVDVFSDANSDFFSKAENCLRIQ